MRTVHAVISCIRTYRKALKISSHKISRIIALIFSANALIFTVFSAFLFSQRGAAGTLSERRLKTACLEIWVNVHTTVNSTPSHMYHMPRKSAKKDSSCLPNTQFLASQHSDFQPDVSKRRKTLLARSGVRTHVLRVSKDMKSRQGKAEVL